MATISSPITSNSNTAPAPAGTSPTSATTPNQATFLKLLVTQIQNQDPLNPSDSTQFLTQLAQFSELEQMIGVNSGVQQLVHDAKSGTQPGTSDSSSGTATAKP